MSKKSKKSINLLTAVAVLAALSGAYIGVRNYAAKQEEDKNEKEEKETVLSASSDEIQSVKFLIDKKEVTFQKDGEEWKKSDEPEFPVNQDVLTEAVGYLNEMQADRVLKDVKDNTEYGLDNPQNTITVTTKDNQETSIVIGMENESTSQYYVEKEGEEAAVYVVSGTSIDPFMKTLYDYAQQSSFPTVDSSSVTKVEVKGQNAAYSLTEDADTQMWDVEDTDGSERADTSKVNTVLTSLTGLAYSSFADYHCTDLSKYGLEKPYAEITVDYTEETEPEETEETEETESEEPEADSENAEESEESEPETETVKKQLTILVGDEAENDGRYVMVNDSNEVYTIANESLSAVIEKAKSDFWNLTVNYLPTSNLDSLEVEYKKEKYDINVSRETSQPEESENQDKDESSETETTTVSYEMNGEKLDETMFSAFYNKMINLTAQKRLEEKNATAETPDMNVKFTDLDGNVTEVAYYAYDTNFYAAVTDEKTYLVNKMNVKEMLEAFEEMM